MELRILNSMRVLDFDICSGEIVYIVVENNQENRDKLRSLRVKDEKIKLWSTIDFIDITSMANEFWNYWSKEKGFELRK